MIGAPVNRIDGPLKVTGRATYAYEEWGLGQPLYGFIVEATIGRGQIAKLDTTRAEQAPGVQAVLTHRDAPPQPAPDLSISMYSRSYPVLAGTEIRYFGQPIAFVVATTFEQARHAAALVDVTYDRMPGAFDFDAIPDARAVAPKDVRGWFETDSLVGDFDRAFAAAPVKIDATYTTPYEHAMAMEPHCCLAAWNGDAVTVHAAVQIVAESRARIATTLGIDLQNVRLIAPYVGAGFGSKLSVHAEVILAVLAARQLKRPVKVAATRQQVFALAGHRPAERQRVRLGAEPDGTLTAFGHDCVIKATAHSDFVEQSATTGRNLYAAANRRTTHRTIDLDLPDGEDVRAPGEAPGLLAIEAAMDELAHALGMDPVDLRLKNEPAKHPERDVPYSDRRMVECLHEGARWFGWDRRPKRPASVRDGAWWVGYGMAAGIRPHFQMPCSVSVRLEPDGSATVRSDMTDIGTGTYTILAQVAAEALAIPVERVRVELGDSSYPPGAGSGGSWGAANSCTALLRACQALRKGNGVEATGSVAQMFDEPAWKNYALASYGAYFAEVHVDAVTAEIRVRRMLGVFDAGRVFNEKTARSQLLGGMIWGIGAALHEETLVDPVTGAFVNRDLAQYMVPVHADIPAVEAVMLDSFDPHANPLGAKGLGELGICGSGAAIANAVFNATGIRIRDYPITLDKLLPHMPPVR